MRTALSENQLRPNYQDQSNNNMNSINCIFNNCFVRMMKSISIIISVSAIVSLGNTSCKSTNTASFIPAEAYHAKPDGFLVAGDEIRVSFSGAPELNMKQKIRANGRISIPAVGDVSAAGMSLTGLQAQVTSLLRPHLQDPTVIVSMESASASVYVSGEVMRPGKVPLDRPMTVLEAVMEAGGFTKFANPKQVIVVRNEGGRNQRYVLNMSETLSASESRRFYLRTYDVVYVKQSNW